MVFEIEGKIALITGGVSGLGLVCAKELLRKSIRGVALVDINSKLGERVIEEVQAEFGANKAIFIKADVTDIRSFEDAFEKTVNEFGNLDILINSAGILNDAEWEREIKINMNGVINGILLGLDKYIPKYKSDAEGVILNMSSIGGVQDSPSFPVYGATKAAVVAMSKSWGSKYHYERSKVKVLVICPGAADTLLIRNLEENYLGPVYKQSMKLEKSDLPIQEPIRVALAMVKIIENARSGTVWIAEDGNDPYEYIPADKRTFSPQ